MKKILISLSLIVLFIGCSDSYEITSKYRTRANDNSNVVSEIELYNDQTCLMQDSDENGHITQINCKWKQLDKNKLKITFITPHKSYVASAIIKDNILLAIGNETYFNIKAPDDKQMKYFTDYMLDDVIGKQ